MAPKLLIAVQFLLCSTFSFHTKAQFFPHFIERLSTNDGLSSNTINDIVQDDNGFLWIATSDGLNRFDGTEVTQYFYQSGANSLPHNYVYCLKKLPGNYLAIGTEGGLSIYNSNNGTFHNYHFTEPHKFEEYNNIIVELELDAKGNLWVVSRNCIYVFDRHLSLRKIFSSPFKESDAVTRRLQYSDKIIPLSDGHVLLSLFDGWSIGSAESNEVIPLEESALKKQLDFVMQVSTRVKGERFELYYSFAHVFKAFDKYLICIKSNGDSLLLVNENGQELSACYFPYNKYPDVLWSQHITEIDSNHMLFLFHNYGLSIISIKWRNGVPTFSDFSGKLFETSHYLSAFSDRQGNWWLASANEGLQKISPSKQVFSSGRLINSATGKQIKYETTSINRYGNILWITTYGGGFFKVELKSGRQQQYHLYNTGTDSWANYIWNLRQINSDTLWLGTQVGLFWFAISSQKHGRIASFPGKPSALDSVAITTQFEDSHGLVWMGLGRGKGVCFFDIRGNRFSYFPNNSEGYPLRYPLAIAEDRKSNLWFTNDASNLLVLWKRNTNRFQSVGLPSATKNLIGNLYEIFCENDSVFWIGSVTNGLIKFNVLRNTLSLFGHDKDLINSHIRSIWQDKTKRLWLVTDGGMSCFDPHTETFFNYSANDGLPVRFPTATLFYDSIDSRLYTGGLGSYFYFDPKKMNTNLPAQNTMITALQVNGKPYAFEPGIPLTFNEQQNDISIHFAAVDFNGGPQTNYSFKLVGEDTGWSMAGHQRQINFSHLAPGHYQFIIRSQNNQGIYNQQNATLEFSIRAPFTQTAWFYTLLVLIIGGIFFGLYQFRLMQVKRTEQIRDEISKNLHDEVGSTLTNISLGSLLAQRQLQQDSPVARLLERIYQDSQTVSQTMREIVWSINPKIDTLGDALPRMLYYASELLEVKGIQLYTTVSPQIEGIKLTMEERRDLYLIFKESINNLARHSDAANARISFQLDGAVLEMTIADDGKGFDKTVSAMGNGLRNIKERAERHKWQLVVQSGNHCGTSLILKARVA
jgi:signal transduction histidine kinase/ligand-binding sensor domain-containing protein